MKLLQSIFQLIFGCRHLSRAFTIKHRTYKVYFDHGRKNDPQQIPKKENGYRVLFSSRRSLPES